MPAVETDGYRFEFADALEAFKFDEQNRASPYYHGVTVLKAVDIVVEFKECTVFIELKEYDYETIAKIEQESKDKQQRRGTTEEIRKTLAQKFRDTLLYRYAENKAEKPIRYICLMINSNDIVNSIMTEELTFQIPVGKTPDAWKNLCKGGKRSPRWKRGLVEECFVADINLLKNQYPDWIITKSKS